MTRQTGGEPIGDGWTDAGRSLARYAIALAGHRADAEDLVQQTVAHLLSKHPGRPFHAGLARRTMTNLFLDEQRSMKRRLRNLARLASRVVDAPVAGDRSDEIAGVRAAMSRLPARQRAVLAMRLIEGLSYEQIAETLACDVGAVRASLHVARRRVRELVGGDE